MKTSTSDAKHSSMELEDQNWFPESLRAYQTDLLGCFARALNLYDPSKAFLRNKIKPRQTLVDLASGSGVPAALATKGMDITLVLSDKFPEAEQVKFMSQQENTEYKAQSIDVINADLPKGDFYTMFNGLHHFSPTEIALILQKVKSKNSSIYFFEPITPNLLVYLKVSLATLFLPFFLVPFIKPFRWDRLIFTYIIPIGVLATFWDGVISVGKSYSTDKLSKLQTSLSKGGISTSHGVLKGKFTNLTYLGLKL